MVHIESAVNGNEEHREHVLRLALEFAEAFSNNADPSVVNDMVDLCLTSGVVLFTKNGFIAGTPVEHLCLFGRTMMELGWYAKDRSGLALLIEFEKVSKELGCKEINMTTLAKNPRADKILTRFGYTPFQVTWSKTIGER